MIPVEGEDGRLIEATGVRPNVDVCQDEWRAVAFGGGFKDGWEVVGVEAVGLRSADEEVICSGESQGVTEAFAVVALGGGEVGDELWGGGWWRG